MKAAEEAAGRGSAPHAGVGHLGVLDGFRAIAILIVMVSHLGLGHLIPGGFGVTIFFFLSGYLITTLLRVEYGRTGEVSLAQFYWRRILRIFPPLYITMLATGAAIACTLIYIEVDARSILSDALFLTNYAPLWNGAHGLPIPLWSLDVEEHFYLIFPIAFATVLARVPGRAAAMACLAACAAVLLARLHAAATLPDLEQVYYWTHTRMDSILFGCCLALWQNPALDGEQAWRPSIASFLAAGAVLALCLIVRDPVFRQTFRYTLQGMALFVVFSFALQDRGLVRKLLSSAPLRMVALLSYTLYLIHVPAERAVHTVLPGASAILAAALTLAVSFAYAGGMYGLVERPLARWRKRSLLAVTRSQLRNAT